MNPNYGSHSSKKRKIRFWSLKHPGYFQATSRLLSDYSKLSSQSSESILCALASRHWHHLSDLRRHLPSNESNFKLSNSLSTTQIAIQTQAQISIQKFNSNSNFLQMYLQMYLQDCINHTNFAVTILRHHSRPPNSGNLKIVKTVKTCNS